MFGVGDLGEGNCPKGCLGGINYRGMSGGCVGWDGQETVQGHDRISVRSYKSICSAVMVHAILVNTQTHRHTGTASDRTGHSIICSAI